MATHISRWDTYRLPSHHGKASWLVEHALPRDDYITVEQLLEGLQCQSKLYQPLCWFTASTLTLDREQHPNFPASKGMDPLYYQPVQFTRKRKDPGIRQR